MGQQFYPIDTKMRNLPSVPCYYYFFYLLYMAALACTVSLQLANRFCWLNLITFDFGKQLASIGMSVYASSHFQKASTASLCI